jgi:hypothetical protein
VKVVTQAGVARLQTSNRASAEAEANSQTPTQANQLAAQSLGLMIPMAMPNSIAARPQTTLCQ